MNARFLFCFLLILSVVACRHAGGKPAPSEPPAAPAAAATPTDEPALAAGEVLYEAQILALPQGVYGSFPLEIRKRLETGRPVPRELVENIALNSRAKLLGTPRWQSRIGEIGSFGVQTYSPKAALRPDPLHYVMVAVDCVLLPAAGRGMTLYTSMSFAAEDPAAHIHGTDKRSVTPASGQYHYYRFVGASADVLVFLEVLTRDAGK